MNFNADEFQRKVINYNNNLLVLASAGSGKTTTIVNKIKHLNVSKDKILVISFTNKTVNSLKKKLDSNVDVFTFHKLALNILKKHNIKYDLVSENYLLFIIDEYFHSFITPYEKKLIKKMFFLFNYEEFFTNNFYNAYLKELFSFIKLAKAHNIAIQDVIKLAKNKYSKLFVYIAFNIINVYNEELKSNNSIDLDDLIIMATEIAKNNKFDYEYIFVDEFQDTSEIRFNLIYSIYQNSKSVINIFGDDYQSIYAFSGCKLNIMLNIKKFIPDINTITLNYNYRLNNDLIKLATNFINKNKKQIKKDIISIKNNTNTVEIVYYTDLKKKVNSVIKKSELISKDIMILARYNHDLSAIVTQHQKLTVHEAKGLESDVVILLNVSNDYYGFPSKVKNNSLINNIINDDDYLFAEERRLFYVAITRTIKKLYIMVPYGKESLFIKEIKKML